jgi:ATP phosphoribosyltransferase
MTLTVALPSKGRMKDDAIATFARAGLTVSAIGNDRSYRGRIDGIDDVEVAFLSASEIARELGAGAVDFGVTGEDLVRESLARADERVEIAARLGFGNADVVVAVPDIWKDVDSMADLGDVAADFRSRHGRRLTIATKVLAADPELLLHAPRHSALPDRREPRCDRGSSRLRSRGYHCRHHLDRFDADGQSSARSLGRGHSQIGSLPGAGTQGRA